MKKLRKAAETETETERETERERERETEGWREREGEWERKREGKNFIAKKKIGSGISIGLPQFLLGFIHSLGRCF